MGGTYPVSGGGGVGGGGLEKRGAKEVAKEDLGILAVFEVAFPW